VNLSDLAKYSVTQSVARSLCNSWASCQVIMWTETHRHTPLPNVSYAQL